MSMELQRVAMAALPASVERLRIRDTKLPKESFEGLDQRWLQSVCAGHPIVWQLAELDLSDSTTLTTVELENILRAWPNITTLKLNRCFNATFSSFFLLQRIFSGSGLGHRRLEVLEADGVPFTDNNFYSICQFAGHNLRRLSVAGCQLYDAFDDAHRDLPKLRSLDVSRCGPYFRSRMRFLRFFELAFKKRKNVIQKFQVSERYGFADFSLYA